ncbi:hypothetical protein D9V37_13050 [Nocardioides mangrovicus]|uniref:Uncharacterized protein n=1 Tax=Nocardioides mangrovicus TaxID=2478913 RepID=A0A3L8P1F7_9ACTN|nr:hypothetical protein [Nocardioides mangrovicus]RLV48663.1 hypothetical protein D9V37_13050 [Nocardioides mangrovicus]
MTLEPPRDRVRPTGMRIDAARNAPRYTALSAALATTLLAVGACGARPASESAASSSSTAPKASPSAELCVGAISKTGTADLDGDGKPDQVNFQAASGKCQAQLVAADLKTATDVGSLQPTSIKPLTVPGRTGQLVIVRETHPRGGYQDHLYGYADGKLVELKVDGRTLLPFVATDTTDPAAGYKLQCADGTITVIRAVAHKPVGIAPAYDIVSTTYAVDGTVLKVAGQRELKDNVLHNDLGQDFPDIPQHQLLSSGCA